MRYSKEELREMAQYILSIRGTHKYRMFTNALCFFTGMELVDVVKQIEELAQ